MKTKQKITNTTAEPITLASIFMGTPAGIEAQERNGQRELTQSSQLPAKINSPYFNELQELGIAIPDGQPLNKFIYEKLGCKVLGESSGDSLFLDVELPEGWKLESTSHSMWNNLVDDKGRTRATIFYKAAFYDREAFFNLNRRYSYSTYQASDKDGNIVEYGENTHLSTYITDGGKPVHLIGVSEDNDHAKREVLGEQAKAWLEDTYPNYKNYFAYWD